MAQNASWKTWPWNNSDPADHLGRNDSLLCKSCLNHEQDFSAHLVGFLQCLPLSLFFCLSRSLSNNLLTIVNKVTQVINNILFFCLLLLRLFSLVLFLTRLESYY